MRPETIGIIGHTGKPGVAELTRTLVRDFEEASVKVLVEERTAALAGVHSRCSVPELAAKTDLLVVLGGDGTILNVVGQFREVITPVFGINMGSLGFLTCASSSIYTEAVRCIVAGEMVFSDRTLLDIAISGGPSNEPSLTALNDVVLSRGEVSRLIRLRARVNGEALTEFNADGLIVATPTGSTAYSLSAGGPILSPESGALVITPICPHVLTNRSIIVGEHSIIEIDAVDRDYPVFVTIDGREPVRLPPGAIVNVKKSDRLLPLAALPGVSFFSVVRQKLKWSGSNL